MSQSPNEPAIDRPPVTADVAPPGATEEISANSHWQIQTADGDASRLHDAVCARRDMALFSVGDDGTVFKPA